MRRIVVLAVVALALVGALALNGTDVLDRLTDDSATPSVKVTPTRTPEPSPTPTVVDPDAPVPGTVLTARPQPRRCPSPPCVP